MLHSCFLWHLHKCTCRMWLSTVMKKRKKMQVGVDMTTFTAHDGEFSSLHFTSEDERRRLTAHYHTRWQKITVLASWRAETSAGASQLSIRRVKTAGLTPWRSLLSHPPPTLETSAFRAPWWQPTANRSSSQWTEGERVCCCCWRHIADVRVRFVVVSAKLG